MSNYIIFTSNTDLGLAPIYEGIVFTRTEPNGVYTYTANTIVTFIPDNCCNYLQ